jgi:phosphohistidine phosphatase SixA
MNLYLVRHGKALPIGEVIRRDADRPLSPRGEQDAALVGRLLSIVEPTAHTIGTSPLLRARRSAEILASQFPSPPGVHLWPVLEPGVTMPKLLAQVKDHGDDPLILVAHQPDITEFLCWLIGDGTVDVMFPPGTAARVVFPGALTAGSARLQWVVPPALLSLLHPEW